MTVESRAPERAAKVWLLLLVAEAVFVVAGLFASGALTGAASPDTAAYFAAAQSANPWGEPRSPLYGYIAGLLGGSATAGGSVALAQAAMHVVSAFILYGGARLGGIGQAGAFALATAALLSQSGLYHLPLLVPEVPAIALLVAGFGLTLAATRSAAAARWLIVPIALFAGASYLLRPTHLPAILALPLLYGLFASRNRQRWALHAAMLLLALTVPFLVQSAVRSHAVGDFNVVSFGGFQMSALAGFVLTPDIIAQLPERTQPTAREILAAREAGEAEGTVARTPLNSAGVRSFFSAALGYYDIYARSYDDLLYGRIERLRPASESWVAFNRRLMDVSVATVMAAPLNHAAWVGGAAARLTGRAIVTNVTMIASLALLCVAFVPAFVRRRDLALPDIGAVAIVAIGWFACTGALTVLVTFPATRYIDTAAVLLPAIPLAIAIALISRRGEP